MSDLQPRGVPLTLGGRDWRLVWTLAVIDRVQEHYDAPVGEAVLRLADERLLPPAVAYLLSELLKEDAALRGLGEPAPTEEEVWRLVDSGNLGTVVSALLESFMASMPEAGDDEKNSGSRSR